jgi:hypothetical protein
MIWLGEEAAITDIAMGGRPILEGKDELMTGSMERADTALVLGPNNEVLEYDVRALAAPRVSSIWRQSMQAKWSSKLSLHGQQLFTPTGIERNLVVGDHMGALLFGRHGVDP